MINEKIDINLLRLESKALFKKYQTQMKYVLRYFWKWMIVPLEIEAMVKHIYLNQFQIKLNKIYHKEWVEFQYLKNDNWSIQTQDKNWKIYNFKLSNQVDTELLLIEYNSQIYREVPGTGSAYSHTLSQANFMEEWLEFDYEAWLITQQEKELMKIFNIVHDIPECFFWDIITTLKTNEDKEKENLLFKEKILSKFSNKNKKIIQVISDNFEDNYSLFKLYERLIYVVFDIDMLYQNREYQNTDRYEKLMFHISAWIFILDVERRLPNGKLLKGIQIPSVYKTLIKNKEKIQNYINIAVWFFKNWLIPHNYKHKIDKYWIDNSIQDTVQIRENFKNTHNI